MFLPKVIIIGSHHHNTLGVIRAIGRAGISPFVIMTNEVRNSYILKSKYISGSVQLNSSDKVIPYLLEEYSCDGTKPVLIACHDRISEILDTNMENISNTFFVPGTNGQKLSEFVNKDSQTNLALHTGLHVPFSVMSDSNYDLESLPYPIITKPAASKDGSKRDICVLHSYNELVNYLNIRKGRTFQIQQFIEKEFEFQLIGCSINGGEEIIIPGVSQLIRTGAGSNTGFLKYGYLTSDFDNTVGLTKEFIRATGYSGLFSVEFLRGRDGKDYFMEMNFRNDGNAICATNAGANLPYFWVQSCLGNETGIPSIEHTEYVMPEYNEIGLWFSGAISTREFIKDLRLASSYMEYAPDDPEPTNGHREFRKRLILAAIKRPAYLVAKRLGLR